MEPLVLFGAGGHAVVIQELVRLLGTHEVAAVVVDEKYLTTCRPEFSKALKFTANEIPALRKKGFKYGFAAVGDNEARVLAGELFEKAGFDRPTLVHPTAIVSPSARIGAGVAILAGAHLGAASSVGDEVILNSGASVDHDCVVGAGVHVCPGATVAGKVKIGAKAWIGVGATVSDLMRIGANCLVGAGSVVVRDLPEDVVAYGVPARVIRKNVQAK
jgi:sugar O-acyltransferase (sialic acid O-acetyltransferase NeuD family)